MKDEQIKQMWVDAWLEQDTRVEPDEEEVKALKSFLAKVKQHDDDKWLLYLEQFLQFTPAPSLEAIIDLIKSSKSLKGKSFIGQIEAQKRLDRPELDADIRHILIDEGIAWNRSFAISKKFLALIPDIEELDKIRDEITKLNKKLDDREEDLIEAKKQERVRIIKELENLNRPDYRIKQVVVYLKYRLGIPQQALKEE